MSEYTNEQLFDSATDLNLIREQCGTLELALQGKPTRPAYLIFAASWLSGSVRLNRAARPASGRA